MTSVRQDSILTTYRPADFSEMIASGADLKLLIQGLNSGRLARVLLLSGGTGTGKTTVARLIANKLAKPTSNNSKSSLNITEQNCAINNGVEQTRELVQRLQLHPIGGGYKVIILDESHRLTIDSQSALLIALEELATHAVVIFCTTHPHKMLEALRCRAVEYRLSAPNPTNTATKLCKIAASEGVDLPLESALIIARGNKGNVRNSLATLARLSVYSEITPEIASEMTRDLSDEVLARFSGFMARDPISAIAELKTIYESDITADELLSRLLEYWMGRAIQLAKDGATNKSETLRGWIKTLSGYIRETDGFSENNKRRMIDHLVFEINAITTAVTKPTPTSTPTPDTTPTSTPTPTPAPTSTPSTGGPSWEEIKAAAIKSRPLYANGLKPVVGQVTGSTLRLINIDPGFFRRVHPYILSTANNLGAHHITQVIK